VFCVWYTELLVTETCRKFGEKICCAGSVTSDAAKQSQVRRYKEATEFLLKSLPHVQRHVSMSDSCRYNRVDKKVKKVAHTRLPSIGFWSWSRFLAVSLRVTWVINPVVGCHYSPPGLQLPPQPLRGLLPIYSVNNTAKKICNLCNPVALVDVSKGIRIRQ